MTSLFSLIITLFLLSPISHSLSLETINSDMTTPYTLTRCRMRDLISCFNARKILTKEDHEESVHHTPKASSNGHTGPRHERDKQVERATMTEKDGGGQESPTSWQSCDSEEDEYIVFCFKDDDPGVDGIGNRGLESLSLRQQDAVEDNNEKKLETREIQGDSKLTPSKSDERNDSRKHEESQEYKDTLGDSGDSSTSSFAFPSIQREWTGSPVLMPRPEGHNKTRSVCVQCCKF